MRRLSTDPFLPADEPFGHLTNTGALDVLTDNFADTSTVWQRLYVNPELDPLAVRALKRQTPIRRLDESFNAGRE